MDLSLVSAGAGLVGATVGGAMSLLGSWIGHQREVRAQWLGQDRLRRQNLYKEFIQEASKCYAHALQNEKPNVPSLVVLYGKISRIRANFVSKGPCGCGGSAETDRGYLF